MPVSSAMILDFILKPDYIWALQLMKNYAQ